MDLIEYQVLLPNKFWSLAKSKVGYPHYEIQRIIKSGQVYVAVCTRR